MRRRVLVLTFLVLTAAGAGAAAYDDFARGLGAAQRGDRDMAIEAFSAAIAAGDLAPNLLPQAYRGRGFARLGKHQCSPALEDFDAALKLKPGDGDITRLHAGAAACLGKFDVALADLSALIAAKFAAEVYRDRGMLRWRMGDYTGAAGDFAYYIAERPKDAYGALWLELVRARAGQLDVAVAAHDVRRYDDDDWPAPLLALYAGRTTSDTALAAAAPDNPGQRCEADFYVAEWLIAKPDIDAGKALLAKARAECPHAYIEYNDAEAELERLQ
jgi:lipoprotein NlpI